MIKITAPELSDMIGPNFSKGLFGEALQINKIPFAPIWVYDDEDIDEAIKHCCKTNDYDIETSLAIISKAKPIADAVGTKSVCCVLPNMTLEKLVSSVAKVMNLKAFV